MNKRLLICGAIATALFVSACVKKEAPKEEDATQSTSTPQVEQENQFQSLESAESQPPAQVDSPTEINNDTLATAEPAIPAPVTAAPVAKPAPVTALDTRPSETPSVAAETPKAAPAKVTAVEPKNTQVNSASNQSSTSKQSEDDAVAAAIAAATPALSN